MNTPPTRADYERIAKKSKGPKTVTVWMVAIFFDGRFSRISCVTETKRRADAFVASFNAGSIASPWSAKARKATITWPTGKVVEA